MRAEMTRRPQRTKLSDGAIARLAASLRRPGRRDLPIFQHLALIGEELPPGALDYQDAYARLAATAALVQCDTCGRFFRDADLAAAPRDELIFCPRCRPGPSVARDRLSEEQLDRLARDLLDHPGCAIAPDACEQAESARGLGRRPSPFRAGSSWEWYPRLDPLGPEQLAALLAVRPLLAQHSWGIDDRARDAWRRHVRPLLLRLPFSLRRLLHRCYAPSHQLFPADLGPEAT